MEKKKDILLDILLVQDRILGTKVFTFPWVEKRNVAHRSLGKSNIF